MSNIFRHLKNKSYYCLAGAIVLYLLSFLFNGSGSYPGSINREKNKLESYLRDSRDYFNKFVSDTSLILRLSAHEESIENLERIVNNSTGIFIYKKSALNGDQMSFWSNQYSFPPEELLSMPDGEYYEKLENGYYVCKKQTLYPDKNNDTLVVVGNIPVQYDYFIETSYFPDAFVYSKNASTRIAVSDTATLYPVESSSGQVLFYITPKAQYNYHGKITLLFFLRLAVVVLLVLFAHFTVEGVIKVYGLWKGVGCLLLLILVFRVISYYIPFPMNTRQFELFDPKIYGANTILKSLGDLLINGLLFCWIVIFIWNKAGGTDKLKIRKDRFAYHRGVLGIIVMVIFTFTMAYIIRSLAANSKISFDVINFFGLTRFTIFGFAALATLAIGYYYFMKILMTAVSSVFSENMKIVYLLVVVVGLSYLTIAINNPLLSFYIMVLLWLVLYIMLLRVKNFSIDNKRLTLASTLFWIFLFSVSITVILIDTNRKIEWESRKRMAYKIDAQSDPYNERQLSISFAYIDDGFLRANFNRFNEQASARFLRDSLLRESGYLNTYDSRLYVFDENGKGLYNDNPETVNTLNNIINVQAKPTNTPNLYFHETSFDKFTFIFRKELKDPSGKTTGSIFILSDPGRYTSETLYPELFRHPGENSIEESAVYSYAIYKNRILLNGSLNMYSFATELSEADLPLIQFEKRTRNNYNELWYRASSDKVVVIAKHQDSVIEAITLFSWIFCSFISLVVIFNLLVIAMRVGNNRKEIRYLLQWNIRTQVHGTIIFVSILSFVIIGVATISFFIQRYEQNNREKLGRTMDIMVNEMGKKLEKQLFFDDQLAIYDSVSNQEVQKLVNEVAEIHSVDVNIYDTAGNLHVTSRPDIYREGFLSRKIHPLAFYHLNRLHQVQHVQDEKLAEINYLSIYAPLRGSDGFVYAYLNIPYFLSQSELKQEISNFLVTIINLNAFIFLIAGVIALFITNRVTRSFSIISEKMKEISLGKPNEEIDWKRDDEIGKLVNEYNKMVRKLSVSADALARNEREGAWREMARQVAHEIKNPLTPMKLSIQYLQKSIGNNSVNVHELTANVTKTLVEQIDHLSKIAFDFSQFANIGNTNPVTFDLKEVLQSLGDLYKNNDYVVLEFTELPEEILLHTDRTQMNRLFTNLFQNAVESCMEKNDCRIIIGAVRNNGDVTVSVKDNGEGIPEEMKAKIFVPNFTTKTSGTGLGLAICKGIVEQAKGRIWFETTKGEGSTFYVELPTVSE